MKRWSAVLVVLLAVGPVARADEASKRAKIQELFVAMHMDGMMSRLTDAVMKQAQQATQSLPGMEEMNPAQKKLAEKFQNDVTAMVTETLNWKTLQPQFVTLYSETYSEEEIDGILAFYKSPVGQKMMEKTPELSTKGAQIAQVRIAAMQPRMKVLMEDFEKQVDAAAAADSKAPTATTSH